MLDLLFLDEDGNNLVDNLPGLPYLHIDPACYRLSVIVNGEDVDEGENYSCQAGRENGRFKLITGANMVGLSIEDTPDAIYVYTITLSCPAIYGDESEHVFKLERKRRNAGLTNNAERLFYDGKLIAEGVEGAPPPGPDEPIVIVVARK